MHIKIYKTQYTKYILYVSRNIFQDTYPWYLRINVLVTENLLVKIVSRYIKTRKKKKKNSFKTKEYSFKKKKSQSPQQNSK